jgi:hypothetical protein
MGLRRSLFGEAIPLDDFTGHMGTITDPLASIAGTGLSEEIIRPIVHLLLTEALVGGGRAARIARLRLGPSMAGQRRFELAWEAPHRYDNVEPERRQIEGMVRLEPETGGQLGLRSLRASNDGEPTESMNDSD